MVEFIKTFLDNYQGSLDSYQSSLNIYQGCVFLAYKTGSNTNQINECWDKEGRARLVKI